MRAYRSFVATLTSLALVRAGAAVGSGGRRGHSPPPTTTSRAAATRSPRRRSTRSTAARVRQLNDVSLGEALRVCAQAAEARPVRPRYQYLYGSVLSQAERYAEAAQQFTAARQAGNAWGALGLGVLSANGSGVPQSYETAASLYREAASAGVALADYNLGRLYEYGSGVPRDASEAARLYHRAIDGGVTLGYGGLTQLSLDATPPRYAEAVRWAQQAADAGYSNGTLAVVLGWGYLTGNGVSQDTALAAKWYVEAARKGSAEAMYRLSFMSRDGLGLPQDAHDAAGWMQQAAEHGHAQAQLELARMLIAGTGVTPDHRAAYGWALEAAKADLVPAQVLVASMAYDGDGVARNRADAVAWFRKAAEHGDTFAMFQLGWLVRDGDGTPRSEAEAMQWFRQAADQGSVERRGSSRRGLYERRRRARPRLPRGRCTGSSARRARATGPRRSISAPSTRTAGGAARHAARPVALREGDPKPRPRVVAQGARKPRGHVAPLAACARPRRHDRGGGRRGAGRARAAVGLQRIGRVVGRIGIRRRHVDDHRRCPVRRRLAFDVTGTADTGHGADAPTRSWAHDREHRQNSHGRHNEHAARHREIANMLLVASQRRVPPNRTVVTDRIWLVSDIDEPLQSILLIRSQPAAIRHRTYG